MTKRTRAIRKQKNKILKQNKKEAWGLMLRKYGLYADLGKTWHLGVRALDDIRWMTQEDIILRNLKGTLAEYRNIYRRERKRKRKRERERARERERESERERERERKGERK